MKVLSSRDGLTFVSEKRGKSKKIDNTEAKNGFNNNHSILVWEDLAGHSCSTILGNYKWTQTTISRLFEIWWEEKPGVRMKKKNPSTVEK